jgi:transcriptional regulator with XRE-family HTH domain
MAHDGGELRRCQVVQDVSGKDKSMTFRRERLVRRRRMLGLSQQQLAERVGVDRSTVVRWERGESLPHPWHRPKMARALKLTAEELDGLLLDRGAAEDPRAERLEHAAANPAGLGLTQAQLSQIENGRAPEELTKLVAWAQTLGIPARLLWFKLPQSDPPEPVRLSVLINGRPVLLPIDRDAAQAAGLNDLLGGLDGSRTTAHLLPGTDVEELEHVAAALNDARRYLDGSVVDYFRNQLDHSKAADGDSGPAKALPLVLGLLGVISQHVREVKPVVRPALLSLASDGAEFAGWLYRDLQDHPSAAYWYDRAMEWAQQANDPLMQSYVLLKKSQMAYDERDAIRVSTLAEAAGHGPQRLPPALQAEITQQQALGLAMLGGSMSAVQAKIDTARGWLDSAVPGDEQERLSGLSTRYFTAETLRLRCAACYTEVGKPAQAAALFGQVLGCATLSQRDRGFFSARRAAALALSGEPDEAATAGLQSIQVAQTMRSQRTVRVLAGVVQTLHPWSSRPGPKALTEALVTTPQ